MSFAAALTWARLLFAVLVEALPSTPLRPRDASTLRRSASIRSSTSPPSSSPSPKVATVSRASPFSSFASISRRSCSWYSSVKAVGSNSDSKLLTRAADISISLALIRTFWSRAGNSAPRTSSAQSIVCSMRTSPRTRSAPSRVFCRSAKETIAVRSVS